ncbi:MAG: 1-acyl-sn-glycerol-3-phosphate acyltransferase [Terriglobia bacterium]
MNDWFYRFGRALLNQTIRLYYRRLEVVGRERIPATGPAILVANHPNSSADAFLLASQLTPRKVNFIAKDTLTRAPVVGWVLRQFGVVGVARALDYERQRDLARQRNHLAIATCVPRLLAGELIVIFGEGISTDARHLHIIRKGALRFGYAAEQAAGFNLGLVWVPVGITYSAKQRFHSDVLIRVGKPFALGELHPNPAAHEHEVLQRGTERFQRSLESLVVNIEREELAGLIDSLAELLDPGASSLAARVERQQRVARAVQYFNLAEPARLAELERALRRYHARLVAADLTDEVVRQRHPTLALWKNLLEVLKSGTLMALNLYGWANSLVPRWGAYLLGPLGRRLEAAGPDGSSHRVVVAKEALWGTYGGWLGAAVAFPLQTYLIFHWVAGGRGGQAGVAVAVLYALSLIPSWRLFVRRRNILRQRMGDLRAAVRFLVKAAPATQLQHQRRLLQRRLRALLVAYETQGPRAEE